MVGFEPPLRNDVAANTPEKEASCKRRRHERRCSENCDFIDKTWKGRLAMPHKLRLVGSQALCHSHLNLKAALHPTVGSEEFKNGLTKIAYSVAVAAAGDGGERSGRTITSAIPLSIDPPLLLISIDTKSRMVDLIFSSKKFSVSMLSCGQEDVADAFSGKLQTRNRFETGVWVEWPSGTPRLTEAVLSLDCELVGSVDLADHILFVGAVVEAQGEQRRFPLLWTNRKYARPTSPNNTNAK
jgi:flavin reductase (DIM6/NTAB) family NADH-FMN oxidoreductase RutF